MPNEIAQRRSKGLVGYRSIDEFSKFNLTQILDDMEASYLVDLVLSLSWPKQSTTIRTLRNQIMMGVYCQALGLILKEPMKTILFFSWMITRSLEISDKQKTCQ